MALLEQAVAAAVGELPRALEAPLRQVGERRLEAGERRRRREGRVEAARPGLRRPGSLGDVVGLGARVGDEPRPQRLRLAHVQRTGGVGPAEPLLRADRVEVGRGHVDVERADRLCAVDEHGNVRGLAQLAPREDRAVDPRDRGDRDQPRSRRHLLTDQLEDVRRACTAHPGDAQPRARPEQGTGQPEVLRVGRRDLVTVGEAEAGDDDVHALGGRVGERDVVGGRADLSREEPAHALAAFDHRLEVGLAAAPVLAFPGAQLRHRSERRPRERAERARVQVGEPVEHREPRALLGPVHAISSSTGA